MAANQWSLHEARKKLSAVVDAALQGRPQLVTRRGRDTVVVISVQDYARLRQNGRRMRRNFKEHLLAIPPTEAGGPDDFGRIPIEPRDIDL